MPKPDKTGARMSLHVSRHFDFPAEQVFDAWLDPDKVKKFLFKTPEGVMTRAEIDARVGGKFIISERREDGDVEHIGEYLEIDRPNRLVFTFGVPKYSKDMSTVTIEIKPDGNGCELTLLHEGLLPEWIEQTKTGWSKILQTLDTIL